MVDNTILDHPDLNDLIADRDLDEFNINPLQIAPSDYYSMEEFQDSSSGRNVFLECSGRENIKDGAGGFLHQIPPVYL